MNTSLYSICLDCSAKILQASKQPRPRSGACIYTLVLAQDLTAGPIVYSAYIHYMHYTRIHCYRSRSPLHREQVWSLIYNRGWMSDHISYMLFYIPEQLVPFALIIDSSLEPLPTLDYIV